MKRQPSDKSPGLREIRERLPGCGLHFSGRTGYRRSQHIKTHRVIGFSQPVLMMNVRDIRFELPNMVRLSSEDATKLYHVRCGLWPVAVLFHVRHLLNHVS